MIFVSWFNLYLIAGCVYVCAVILRDNDYALMLDSELNRHGAMYVALVNIIPGCISVPLWPVMLTVRTIHKRNQRK